MHVVALPMAVLVKDGRILWRGHVDDIDLDATIEGLLRGETAIVVGLWGLCILPA